MPQGFAEHDTRHYSTVDGVTGVSAWSHTYDHTVHDSMLPVLRTTLASVLRNQKLMALAKTIFGPARRS